MPKTKYTWEAEAAALASDELVLPMPVHAMLGEARDVASFFRAHYNADNRSGTPGLASVGLPDDLADQIDALISECSNAFAKHRQTVSTRAVATKLDRARAVIDELGAALEFLFNDGAEDENDARLASVRAAHKDDPSSPDAFALALEDYAFLAELHRAALDGLGDFDVALIADARKLAGALREVPEQTSPSPETKAALAVRNRLLQLLAMRVKRVRVAATYVFRHHPDIARGVSSTYVQKRRVEARRAATRRRKNGKKEVPVTPNA